MRRTVFCLCAATLLAGCTPRDQDRADTATVAPPATAAPAATPAASGAPLAAAAGRWNVRVMNEAGDSVAAYVLEATSNTSGWTITFPGRAPQPVTVTTAGDSIMTEVGPYDSVLRPGTQVVTRSVSRIEGDRIHGTARASYRTAGADSVVNLRTEGRRAP